MRTIIIGVVLWMAGAGLAQGAPCGLACLEASLREAEKNGPPATVAMISNQLGVLLQKQHRLAEAEAAYLRSAQVLDTGSAAAEPELARTLTNLGSVYYQQGQYDRAAAALRRAVTIWEHTGGQSEPDFASALDNLGTTLRCQAKYSEAEPVLRRALAIREQQGRAAEVEKATVLHNLALLHLDMARYDEAEEGARQALAIRERRLGSKDHYVADTRNLLGLIAQARGRNAEAAQQFRVALLAQNGYGLPAAQSMINLGAVSRLLGDVGSAREVLERAVALVGEIEPKQPLMATALNNLGLLEATQGNVRRARQLFERALAIWRDTVGPDHPDYASGLTNLASVEHGRKALQLCSEALRIDEAAFGPAHPRVETDLNNAGMAALSVRDYAAAEHYFRRSLAAHTDRGAPETAEEALVMANLANAYTHENNAAEAAETYRRAIAMLRTTTTTDDPRLGAVLEAWSRVLRASGSYAEAEQAEVTATGIRVHNALLHQ